MPPPLGPICTQPTAVLVIQDQSALRHSIASVLRRAGFAVREAFTVAQGKRLLQTHRNSIDLTTIDLVMTDMSGLDVAVQGEHDRAGIAVLFISGPFPSIVMEGLQLRFPERVLVHPFSREELLARVAALL